MDTYEATNHPFRIKIWLEEPALKGRGAVWHGYIVHVPSGRRCFLNNLDDISDFVAPYLAGMGVKLGPVWWVRRQLRARKSCSR